MAGHLGDEPGARRALVSPSPELRASALTALARLGALGPDELVAALADSAGPVRRRACDTAARAPSARVSAGLVTALADADAGVVEAAAYALGETEEATELAVTALAEVVFHHPEALCREAAVAALGALGDPAGLGAVLAGCGDKPAVRRRAVIALAAFEGPEVEAALARASSDTDWQVRQAAEDLVGRRPEG